MKAYLDTSVILRRLLGEPGALREWGRWSEGYTSEITRVEALRALERLRLQGELNDAETADLREGLAEVLSATNVIALTQAVLERAAGSFPTVIGTLDAIHLSSALVFHERREENLIFLTHDARLATAARAEGLQILG